MGKKRKRKNKPAAPEDKQQENTINSENPDEEQAETPENTEIENKDESSENSEEEEKRISRRQKIAEIDRSLAKTLEARDAGKKKDLRDPITKFFQETGKAAIKYKNTISIALMM